MGVTGLEPDRVSGRRSSELRPHGGEGGAESGAVGAAGGDRPQESPHVARDRGTSSGPGDTEPADEPTGLAPELAELVRAWPTLPEPIRRAMLALVDSARSESAS